MTDEIRLNVLALGVVLLLPGLGAIWKTATLRGDVFKGLAERVDIAKSALSEISVAFLRLLQKKTDDLLGSPYEFDPASAVADPGQLTVLTRKFQAAIVARDRLDRRFDGLLWICKWAFAPATAYSLGVVMSTATFAMNAQEPWIRWTGPGLVAATLVVGIGFVGAYHYLHAKIASAEIMANEEVEDA